MAKYPRDQFDDIPADLIKVGAHRSPARKGRGWITFAWAALATGVLVIGGLYYLSRIGAVPDLGLPFAPAQSESPTPSASADTTEPVTDPTTIDPARNISITVLNATTTVGLENAAGDALAAAKWPVGTRTTASTHDEKTTVIYYSDPANEDVALGIKLALGVGAIRESSAFLGAPITIVLGADYSPTK
jgi:LytR cell envelope-related transcriptional attenuator